MANQEHVAVVKQSNEAISAWLEQYPGQRLELNNADLHGANLTGAYLTLVRGAYRAYGLETTRFTLITHKSAKTDIASGQPSLETTPTDSSSTYKIATSAGINNQLPQTGVVSRRTSLEGRVNIYVAPEDQNTRVSVNIRYVLTVKAEGTYMTENRYGTPIQSGTIPAQTFTDTFNTNQPSTKNWGTPQQPLA
jgi:hypothetical protein